VNDPKMYLDQKNQKRPMRVLRPLIFIGVLLNSATVAAQMCQSPDSDADGDGWGWENNRS